MSASGRGDRLLLDTHIFLWWRQGARGLCDKAIDAIANASAVHVSLASAWEATIKASLGKLKLPGPFADGVRDSRFEPLSITFAHLEELARLPHLHRDPFDRLLVAQARSEGLRLVTADAALAEYDANVWLV